MKRIRTYKEIPIGGGASSVYMIGGSGGRVVETGSWRTFKPVIDNEICVGCGLCEVYCPESCISKSKSVFAIDYRYCKGCGICAHECPAHAVTMMKE
jgi:2-oxoacid:acceptor oxidoreductase delta subunit (pyruvate/2-ketoisovalerate family)